MTLSAAQPRVALVHDWLTGMRGGELVLDAIAELFPQAELFTLLYVPGKLSPNIVALKRHTSLLQRMPMAERKYRHYLPLMPKFAEGLDVRDFDLIVSSSHCVAKGVRKRPDAVHVSYVHAPMRYMWDRFDDYFGPGRASLPVRLAARALRPYLQGWDRRTSQDDNVDVLVANSQFIAGQIRAAYGREASVIYPFVDYARFANQPRAPGKSYLMVGAFAPNKRVDVAIEAFNRLKLPLLIVGGGQEERRLRKMAGPTIDFLGQLSNSAIADLYAKCRAFIFPGLEDFGITPLEAMAAGAPVIAYGAGGATETVTSETGILFKPQTPEALMDAVSRMESGGAPISPEACRARAAQFSRERFQREFQAVVQAAVTAKTAKNWVDS
ncbi:MAG: glycosyltransferase [Bacteriovoracia bacterium]